MTNQQARLIPKVFRGTQRHEGWREVFAPKDGHTQYLTYARLVFGPNVRSHTMAGDDREWAAFCIVPPATVTAGGRCFEMAKNDILYIPRGCTVEIVGRPGTDLAFGGSPAHIDSEAQLIRCADIREKPEFVIDVGTKELGTQRRIYNMLGGNVRASRLLAGFTVGTPGAWTSWPPHEHDESKEEFYLFFDMPAPAMSVQLVYASPDRPACCEPVQDGDCVAIPWGYHPTAAAPGHCTCFFWCMAAFDPDRHRDLKYGLNIEPAHKNIRFF